MALQFSEPLIQIHGNGTYKSVVVTIGKATRWRIMKCPGHIDVCKLTNNPFGGKIGKWFDTFSDAQEYYSDPNLKTALLMAEQMFGPPASARETVTDKERFRFNANRRALANMERNLN